MQSPSKVIETNWNSINSFEVNNNCIVIKLANKKYFLIPKRAFSKEDAMINFLGIIETEIIKARGVNYKMYQTPVKSNRPPYWLGLFCLIPLVGTFVGIVFIVLGITKFKDKWFTLIGVFGILFTVAVYSALFYESKHSSSILEADSEFSQSQLNSLIENIEFYKIEHGQYPDSLQNLRKENAYVMITDVIQLNQGRKNDTYNYQRIGNKYTLFSSGQDGIANTKDDLFPKITITDSSKIGLVRLK